MKSVVIYGSDFENIKQVHEFLAGELDFPDYYGANLDALYDVLTERDQPVSIEIHMEDIENPDLLQALEKMTDVIADATAENEAIELTVVEV
ncbi:MAG: barstar family protein [Blautia sp.]|nr:barstar family protein [Blautia sp.]